MPRFRYVALDAGGAQITGECESSEPEALGRSLAASGLTLLQLERMQPADGSPLNEADSQMLAQHVAGLANAGLPMPSGLQALREELPKGRLRSVVGELAERMERGQSLEEAFDAIGNRLPSYLRGLILSGTRSGKLGTMLGDFVSFAQRGTALRYRLWMSLAYPMMLLFMFAVFMTFVCLVLIQGFKAIFMDFGIDLPWLTRDLIALSDLMTRAGWGIVWAPVLILTMGWLLSRILLEPAARRRLLCSIPLIGPVWRLTSLAEWTRYLALLLDAQLTMVEALPLAAECTRDADLVVASHRASSILKHGGGLGAALASSSVFPDGLTRLLHWAEQNGATVAALNLVSEMFDSRSRAHLEYVSGIVGIVTAIFVVWGCAFVIVAVFWPLFSLLSKLSG
jgi:type II secretory pathway component PulF